jgi:hypothetical protein
MIARRRGEHDPQGIWRPRRTSREMPAPPLPASVAAEARRSAAVTVLQLMREAATDLAAQRQSRRRRTRVKVLLMLAVGASSLGAHELLGGSGSNRWLPATPRQWVDAYEAAAIDSPHRVCKELFSPQLAAAYAANAHATCTKYFARIRSSSLHVRRILEDGGTAVVELHQTIESSDWDAVLARRGAGWRAVDLVPGRPLR